MTPIRNYRDLFVWQKSVKLVTDIYAITKTFPNEELFGLTSQIRRAAISIKAILLKVMEEILLVITKDFYKSLLVHYTKCKLN